MAMVYTPSRFGEEKSQQQDQGRPSQTKMVALQERNRGNGSACADSQNGHKVVAMPSTLNVQEVVSSRNGTFNANRPRSLSAGRAATRPRDIVQEVYDRIGVSRDAPAEAFSPERRGHSSPSLQRGQQSTADSAADKFSQRYREAAALTGPRGRSADSDVIGERRSRSLSRGRAVAGRWPPAPASEPSPVQTPVKLWKKEEATPVAAVPPSPNRKPQYSRSESQDDSEDNDSLSKESQEKDVTTSIPSGAVKDRISAYAGVRNSSRSFNAKKQAHKIPYGTPRERPPKIDIYEEARRLEPTSKTGDEDDKNTGLAPAPSAIPPSPAAAAAADAAAELVYRRSSVGSAKSLGRTPKSTPTPKASSGITGGYLAAIKSPPSANKPVAPIATDAPLAEISAADGNGDGNSVAASSVSVDDFAFSPSSNRGESASAKKPSWTERHNKTQVSPTARSANGGYYSTNDTSQHAKPAAPASADIEKIVEQRVQARVCVVEMRMEEKMQRLEKRMEERMKARIDVIDEKIDKMNSMLAMLLSRELSGNENRENEI
jgi:hypothetical protein